MIRLCLLSIFCLFLVTPPAGAAGATRVALVIGNADYAGAALKNPVNDAEDMAATLKKLDFDVVVQKNANRREMIEAIQSFGQRLRSAQIGLFYYAGHGVQIDGRNFLLPVKSDIKGKADVEFEAVNANRILVQMEDAGNEVGIVILDACRNNPFRDFRGVGDGLAAMQSLRGSFVAYATAPGSVAADGSGRNGIYTKHILKNLGRQGLSVEEIFRDVRAGVMQETGGAQVPWDSSSLASRVVLVETPAAPLGMGRLAVKTEPAGAEILVDDRPVGAAPLVIADLGPGEVTVKADRQGYKDKTAKASIQAGRETTLSLTLEPAAQVTGPVQGTGKLYVQTTPQGARVFVDEEEKGVSPLYVKDLPASEVLVRAELEGYPGQQKFVEIKPGKVTQLTLALEKSVTTGRLVVKPEPANATVKVLNIAPRYQEGMELAPGKYHIEASKPDFESQRQWVDLTEGQELEVKITLKEAAPAPASQPTPPAAVAVKKEPRSGDTWTEPTTGMEFVWVPGGCFQMGSYDAYADEKPVHEVCLDGFWMGKYEVTQEQWQRIMGLNPSDFKKGGNYPVEQVSWNDAQDFILKLNAGGSKLRLPTEAAWEYACCSGGEDETYSGGNSVGQVAWYLSNSGSSTHPVGTKSPNHLGLYDLSGNVWEWVEDIYSSMAYSAHGRNNPIYTGGGASRVARGGSWLNGPAYVRCAHRGGNEPGVRSGNLGFRLVRTQ